LRADGTGETACGCARTAAGISATLLSAADKNERRSVKEAIPVRYTARARLSQMGAILCGAARLPIAGDQAASKKFIQPGMCSHYRIAGSRQRVCGILNPLSTIRLR